MKRYSKLLNRNKILKEFHLKCHLDLLLIWYKEMVRELLFIRINRFQITLRYNNFISRYRNKECIKYLLEQLLKNQTLPINLYLLLILISHSHYHHKFNKFNKSINLHHINIFKNILYLNLNFILNLLDFLKDLLNFPLQNQILLLFQLNISCQQMLKS